MKRPQLNGNKVTTRYSDANSLVLRNFIDLSTHRLSKVKAGSQLTAVLKQQAPSSYQESFRSHNPTNLESDPTSRQQLFTQQTDRPNSQSQLPLSKFMEQYLNQKGADPGVLMEKENNIYSYFKEKFGLMSKYLGEEVLQDGLFVKQKDSEGKMNFADKLKKSKNIDIEDREQYLINLMKNEGAADPREGSTAKVMKINRDIMRQLLKEEHQKEMEELLKLQTEQNMQVFNDLQDIAQDTNKQNHLTVQQKTPPSKIILKNNFLRTYVNEENERPMTTYVEEKDSPEINISFRKIPQQNRPYSEQLVFRTKQKKEQILPDVGKIVNILETHKFGGKTSQNQPDNSSSRSQAAVLKENGQFMNTNERKMGDLRARTAFSVPKLESPRIVISNLASNTTTNTKQERTLSSVKNERVKSPKTRVIKQLIDEEIEFLNRQRAFEEVKRYSETHRIENRNSLLKNYNSLATTDVNKTPTGTLSTLDNHVYFPKTTTGKSIEKIMKPRVKVLRSKNNHLNKKSLTSISPRPDFSALRSLTRNSMMLKHANLKHDFEITNSMRSREENQSIRIQNNKQGGYVTKLVSITKNEQAPQTSINSMSFSRTMIQLDMAMNGQTPVGMIMKNGNKYWKNNFE